MTYRSARLGAFVSALLAVVISGCSGSTGNTGPAGADGAPGAAGANGTNGSDATASGTLSGTVADTYGNKVAGVTVSTTVGADPLTTTSDANGAYSLILPPGPRTVSFAATGYLGYSQTVEATPVKSVTLNVTLNPTGPAAVTAARTDTAKPVVPGLQVALKASVLKFDGALASATPTYQWTVLSGPPATFDDATSATPKATLASSAEFKKYVVELAAPLYKVNPDEPPVNVDRYQVVPVSYEQAMSQGNTTTFRVTVTVGGQTYQAKVAVAATIPVVPSSGLKNVPVKSPVLLQGQFPFKNADGSYVFGTPRSTWSWTVTGPSGAVTVNDADTAYPDFTPAEPGTYTVVEGGLERFKVYADTFQGVMTGPATPSVTCTACHNGVTASDKFTAWQTTGHKAVMFAGIMEALPDGHYSKSCTPCHTVGAGQTGAGGFADKLAAEAVNFTPLQGDLNAEADFWKQYPASAQVAGIQCENCHGPQENGFQHWVGDNGAQTSRVSYSANVCATCHARAPKHGRFSQWKKSGHASYATFTFNSAADGTLANTCACCHSAQGFKAMRAILPTANGNRSLTTLSASLSLANAEPITCAACHDAHDEGDASKAEWGNLSKVGPVEGSTYMLPSGFAAVGVGKGALCIACHNSRQGISSGAPYLHEDGDVKFGTLTSYGAPHEAAQGDVLLGRNGYWFGAKLYNSPQTRSMHSYITDTCVTCHMELTTLDLTLSEAGQTRHDFTATPDVCNKCHTAYSTESVQAAFDASLASLKTAVGTAILRLKFNGAIPAGTTAVLVANRSGQVDVTAGGVTRRWFISTKTGQDAFLADPGNGGALVQGCTGTATLADCTGYLAGAPGVTTGLDATQDGTVSATGVNGVVAKALWNTVLVQDDASRGVHNPSFAFQVIDNSVSHVSTLTR